MKRNKRAQAKNIVEQVKLIGCYFCGEKDIDILQLAHVDSTPKRTKGGNRFPFNVYTVNKLVEELENCEVMCSNCHIKFDLGRLKLGRKNEEKEAGCKPCKTSSPSW